MSGARMREPTRDAAKLAAAARHARDRAVECVALGIPRTARSFQAHARDLEQLLRDYADEILAGCTAIESRLVLAFEGGPAWPIINCPRGATPAQWRAWRLSATGHSREWLEPGLVVGELGIVAIPAAPARRDRPQAKG